MGGPTQQRPHDDDDNDKELAQMTTDPAHPHDRDRISVSFSGGRAYTRGRSYDLRAPEETSQLLELIRSESALEEVTFRRLERARTPGAAVGSFLLSAFSNTCLQTVRIKISGISIHQLVRLLRAGRCARHLVLSDVQLLPGDDGDNYCSNAPLNSGNRLEKLSLDLRTFGNEESATLFKNYWSDPSAFKPATVEIGHFFFFESKNILRAIGSSVKNLCLENDCPSDQFETILKAAKPTLEGLSVVIRNERNMDSKCSSLVPFISQTTVLKTLTLTITAKLSPQSRRNLLEAIQRNGSLETVIDEAHTFTDNERKLWRECTVRNQMYRRLVDPRPEDHHRVPLLPDAGIPSFLEALGELQESDTATFEVLRVSPQLFSHWSGLQGRPVG